MISRNILLSAVLVFQASGCSEEDPNVGTGGGNPICEPERSVCMEDTICGESGCEPAYDREYQVRLTAFVSGRGFEQCPGNEGCPPPYVAVYYSDLDDPILDTNNRVNQIRVKEETSLIVDLGESNCMIDLTSERLRSGHVTCARYGPSAYVSLIAMPRGSHN